MAPLLFTRLTPVPPEALDVVLPKLSVALDEPTLTPIPVGSVTVVVGVVRLPATLLRLTPVVPLVLDEMLPKVAARVPVVRSRA